MTVSFVPMTVSFVPINSLYKNWFLTKAIVTMLLLALLHGLYISGISR
jgi:hypothetical protein